MFTNRIINIHHYKKITSRYLNLVVAKYKIIIINKNKQTKYSQNKNASYYSLIFLLAEFFYIGFHYTLIFFLDKTAIVKPLSFFKSLLFKYAHGIPMGSNLLRRISGYKDEMIKVHKNVRLNKEAGR